MSGGNTWSVEDAKAHPNVYETSTHIPEQDAANRLLNRFGHTEDDAFATELEGALEEALKSCDKMDPSLVPEEYSNVVHSQ